MEILTNKDDLRDWMWQGPENTEVKQLVQMKNEFEIKEGIQMSKQGIINFVDDMIKNE